MWSPKISSSNQSDPKDYSSRYLSKIQEKGRHKVSQGGQEETKNIIYK